MEGIGSIGAVGATLPLDALSDGVSRATPDATHDAAAPSFDRVLLGVVDQANTADRTAAQQVASLAAGTSDDLHGTMIATREADISVRLVGSIRNKLLDAFHELWRTSV